MSIFPKVSVLIPTYNYAHFISEAIESVLQQTFEDFELIIVDNCSTDNTVEIVKHYIQKDKRVKIIQNDVNIGMYRNYNKALLSAKGKYIKFLNSDDKLQKTNLEKFVKILDKNENISLVSSHRQYFDQKNDLLLSSSIGLINGEDAILKSFESWNYIGEPTTVMFRKKNLNLGLFDISLLMFADLDMWLRQLTVGDLYIIDEVLSYFRIHEKQGTNNLNDSLEKELYNVLQKYLYINNAIEMNIYLNLVSVDKKRIKKQLSNESFFLIKYYFKKQKYKDALRTYIHSMFFYFFRTAFYKLFTKLKGIIEWKKS
jgi:glycosyltransferase involved in cell wall biosynthesis